MTKYFIYYYDGESPNLKTDDKYGTFNILRAEEQYEEYKNKYSYVEIRKVISEEEIIKKSK